MISPSLHPVPIRAACERRRRMAFGLTPRSIGLFIAGILLLVPAFWDARLIWAMVAFEFLVLLAALFDGLRLPRAAQLTAGRSWSNAPALDSETEIELTIENQGPMIVECRLVDDLPPALVANPATYRLTAFPRVPASVRYRVEPTERGDWETGWLYVRYRSPLGLAERWARAPLTQTVRVYPALRTGEEQQIFLARSRQIDLQLRQARQRGLGRDFESLRDYREGDDLRDVCWTASARRGALITRQYQTERSQAVWIVLDCGRLMRSRVSIPSAVLPSSGSSSGQGSSSTSGKASSYSSEHGLSSVSGHDFSRAETAQRKSRALAPEGARFRIFLGGYLAWRLAIDFLKPQPLFDGLNLIQWSCLAGILLLIFDEARVWKGKHETIRA